VDKHLVRFLGKFLFNTVAAMAVIYSLTYAANVISRPSSTLEMVFAFLLFVTAGAVVFDGIRSSLETYAQHIKQEENNDEQV
jgi:hypothetical protein